MFRTFPWPGSMQHQICPHPSRPSDVGLSEHCRIAQGCCKEPSAPEIGMET